MQNQVPVPGIKKILNRKTALHPGTNATIRVNLKKPEMQVHGERIVTRKNNGMTGAEVLTGVMTAITKINTILQVTALQTRMMKTVIMEDRTDQVEGMMKRMTVTAI